MPFPRERWCHERCPCTFQRTLATIPSARFTERLKKERETERKKEVAEVSYKNNERERERESEQQRGQRNNKSHPSWLSPLTFNCLLYSEEGNHLFICTRRFLQLSLDSIQSDIIVYSQFPADCVGFNRISASMDARLIQLIRFFGEYFCPGREEHQLSAMTYVNKWAATPRKVYWTPNNRHDLL